MGLTPGCGRWLGEVVAPVQARVAHRARYALRCAAFGIAVVDAHRAQNGCCTAQDLGVELATRPGRRLLAADGRASGVVVTWLQPHMSRAAGI